MMGGEKGEGRTGPGERKCGELGYPGRCSSFRVDSDESPDQGSDGSTDVSQ